MIAINSTDKREKTYIISSLILLSVIMTAIDLLNPNYLIKSFIKVVLFMLVPFVYFLINKNDFGNFKKLFTLKKNTLLNSVTIGLLIYAVIIGGYFILKNYIDFSGITASLTENNGINKSNFVYVSIYISLINSFLEEFFFRGFGFITLKHHTSRRLAYIISSSLFAVYHLGMLIGMFEIWILPLLFIGLFVGGCIFNYLNEKSESIYTSWATHMFANFAINTVGFILFGII